MSFYWWLEKTAKTVSSVLLIVIFLAIAEDAWPVWADRLFFAAGSILFALLTVGQITGDPDSVTKQRVAGSMHHDDVASS